MVGLCLACDYTASVCMRWGVGLCRGGLGLPGLSLSGRDHSAKSMIGTLAARQRTQCCS